MFLPRYLTAFFVVAATTANASVDMDETLEEIREGGGAIGEDRHPDDTLEDLRDAESGPIGTERHGESMNVWGEPMERCSGESMAMTGIDGYCDDVHYADLVCVNLETTTKPGAFGGLFGAYDFCETIGETDPNWCDMMHPCHRNPHVECSVANWCVGITDFADFIHEAGGCDKVGQLSCEATNEQVVIAYKDHMREEGDPDQRFKAALACIQQRCGNSVH